jgi:hypothetical protein
MGRIVSGKEGDLLHGAVDVGPTMCRDDRVELITELGTSIGACGEEGNNLEKIFGEIIHLGAHTHVHARNGLRGSTGIELVNKLL